jgi:putative DNA primase/helicase
MMTKSKLKEKLAQATAVLKWCLKSEDARRINAMLEMAKSEPGIPILPEEMDRDSWLFNCLNGTLELKTGRLREHRREDYITLLCPVEYHPAAQAPRFQTLLQEIFNSDDDLIGYLQRLAGRCLTGDVSEQALHIFWGTGANGKSTLLNVLLEMLGPDYGMKAPTELLMARRGEAHPTERADLFGKRLMVCAETEEGRRLAEAFVKELTGGDRIRARRMREDFWEFMPTHKVILCTNHKPAIRGTDHAIWRRVRLVPFTVTFAEDQQDKQLPEKLRAELPGILAWAVEGCLEWQRSGMQTPKSVLVATEEYRTGEDTLAQWLAQCCKIHDTYRQKASELYVSYHAWCEQGGERPRSQRVFGEAMTERGFKRMTSNGVWYLGVRLEPVSIW